MSHGPRKTVNVTKTAKWMKGERRKKKQKTAKKSDEKKTFFSENFVVGRIDP